jgi:hypothetical protein
LYRRYVSGCDDEFPEEFQGEDDIYIGGGLCTSRMNPVDP